MVQRFFCDLCEIPCPGTPTRRWEHIQGDLGLEVVVLQGASPISEMHVCDECVIKMFWAMVERISPSSIKKTKEVLKNKETDVIRREHIVSIKEKEQEQLIQELVNREKVIIVKEEEIAKSVLIVEQARIIKYKETELVRLAEARGRQQAIDEFDARRRGREGRH